MADSDNKRQISTGHTPANLIYRRRARTNLTPEFEHEVYVPAVRFDEAKHQIETAESVL
jgi:hypothetical protein